MLGVNFLYHNLYHNTTYKNKKQTKLFAGRYSNSVTFHITVVTEFALDSAYQCNFPFLGKCFMSIFNLLIFLLFRLRRCLIIYYFLLCFSSSSNHFSFGTFCFILSCPENRIPKVLHSFVHCRLKMSVNVTFQPC